MDEVLPPGMSALLTTTLPKLGETTAMRKETGPRERVEVMVGGAPVTQAYAAAVDRAKSLAIAVR